MSDEEDLIQMTANTINWWTVTTSDPRFPTSEKKMSSTQSEIDDNHIWTFPKGIGQTDLECLIGQLECMKEMIDFFERQLKDTQKIAYLKHLMSDIKRQFITPWHELCAKYNGEEIIGR